MNRCIIVGAGEFFPGCRIHKNPGDLLIAADGGYQHLEKMNLVPDLLVADFDSLTVSAPAEVPVMRFQSEKDDTDMGIAIAEGIRRGYTEFLLYGGTGGRQDHTFANYQALIHLARAGKRGYLIAESTLTTAIADSCLAFHPLPSGFVSIFAVDNECKGVCTNGKYGENNYYADHVIVATGRRGADWLEKICNEHKVEHTAGTVDIGVRVEVRNEIMEQVNEVLYESKLIGYPNPFKNKVRTFCQNPGGFVSQENYDNDLAVVNGHSYKDMKSDNTNLAILCSHNFSVPFNQPIAYAQKVGELTNMLGAGHILVQRFGDILNGKRTWQKELAHSNVRPTLPDAVAGDITSAMPYRAMVNIINFIKALDEVVPGFASEETLLYSPELKFYSNRVKMDENLNTSMKGLHCLGDSSGWTRGLMMASVMGVAMGRALTKEEE